MIITENINKIAQNDSEIFNKIKMLKWKESSLGLKISLSFLNSIVSCVCSYGGVNIISYSSFAGRDRFMEENAVKIDSFSPTEKEILDALLAVLNNTENSLNTIVEVK